MKNLDMKYAHKFFDYAQIDYGAHTTWYQNSPELSLRQMQLQLKTVFNMFPAEEPAEKRESKPKAAAYLTLSNDEPPAKMPRMESYGDTPHRLAGAVYLAEQQKEAFDFKCDFCHLPHRN
jgi:hypothetical protein